MSRRLFPGLLLRRQAGPSCGKIVNAAETRRKSRGGPVSRILCPRRHAPGGHGSGRRPFLSGARRRAPPAAYPGLSGSDVPAPARAGHEAPIRHCSRWGLPCGSGCPSPGGLLPHRFTLAAPEDGGLFSVALSLGLPRPGVTRHRVRRESGLSSIPLAGRRGRPALRASPALTRRRRAGQSPGRGAPPSARARPESSTRCGSSAPRSGSRGASRQKGRKRSLTAISIARLSSAPSGRR
ncbi:hypothetical protein SAMN05444417_0604 [Wenxinia saemankumensis]|uniref:Uncharacterized protein n=1 Tax=Wenxinia saemankumensis TaxID=1447782 RepID=A0A1M6ASX3_9RHOB|nr:hypothetical protein SAMN05444417_0604 [Wenxinia saemankumensis]